MTPAKHTGGATIVEEERGSYICVAVSFVIEIIYDIFQEL